MSNLLYKGRLVNIFGLMCLTLFLRGLATEVAASDVPKKYAFSSRVSESNSSDTTDLVFTIHGIPDLVFDFENTQEREPEPTGKHDGPCKGISSPSSGRFSWSDAENSRTNSTLVSCTSSLLKRKVHPLFVLHHSWKNFPS